MKNILTRTISGIIYIAIILCCIGFGTNTIALLGALLGVLATIELARIDHELNRRTIPVVIMDCVGVALLATAYLWISLPAWIALMLCRMILELYINDSHPLRNMALSMFSQIYIGLPMGLMPIFANLFSPTALLAVFILIWLNDTGAYIFGCTFGRHRLFERISPKKSWEGFVGALVICVGAAVAAAYLCAEYFNITGIWQWIGLALVTVVFATWGDLVESLIKRSLTIKDSGKLIPGHGGILDRIDSLLFVIPAAFLYLLLLSFSKIAYLL